MNQEQFRQDLINWLEECNAFESSFTEPDDFTTEELADEVNKQYCGGLSAFIRDGE